VIPGKRNCHLSIYGNYVTGTKKLATITKIKDQENSIDNENSDDFVDTTASMPVSEQERQRTVNDTATSALLTDSLLPASVLDIEASSLDYDYDSDKGIPVPPIPVQLIGLTLAEHCIKDEKFLASYKHLQDFRRYCPTMPPRVTRFPYQPDDPDNALLLDDVSVIPLPGCEVLPPGVDAEHILSEIEQELCAREIDKTKLIWSNWDYFHGVKSASQLQTELVATTKERYHQIVLLGGAFTNSVWATDSTLHHDRQLFYNVITNHGLLQHGTFCPALSNIPLGTVGLGLLLIYQSQQFCNISDTMGYRWNVSHGR
jgi:hypothetical protein